MRTMITWTFLLCLAGLATVASANDSAAERASLTGLTSLSVVIEDLSAVAGKSGLIGATLQSDVERRLRQAGIAVAADADAYSEVRSQKLEVRSSLRIGQNLYFKVLSFQF
jgi:hypothetical protein